MLTSIRATIHGQVLLVPESKILLGRNFSSGASRDRTGDLLLAKQALSQLSYGPAAGECSNRARVLSEAG